MIAPTHIPTNSAQRFPFLHVLTSTTLLVAHVVVILTGVRCYVLVVLVGISGMISVVEHLFMYLSAMGMSSLEKNACSVSTHFFMGLFVGFYAIE